MSKDLRSTQELPAFGIKDWQLERLLHRDFALMYGSGAGCVLLDHQDVVEVGVSMIKRGRTVAQAIEYMVTMLFRGKQ